MSKKTKGKPQKQGADKTQKLAREAFARSIFEKDPHLPLKEAERICTEKFGVPIGYTKLSAIRAAYCLINGIHRITKRKPPT